MQKKGMLVVISGPAGVGKGTLCRALLAQSTNLDYSVSVTTRASRPGETDGKEYFFRSKEEFQKMIENGELLEWAEFLGNFYGTPRFHVEAMLNQGKTIILEIDIQGGKQVKNLYSEGGVFIFIVPPSFTVLSNRLRGRGTESEEVIQNRLARAHEELENVKDYDYVVENNDLKEAVEKLKSIIVAENCSTKRVVFFSKEE